MLVVIGQDPHHGERADDHLVDHPFCAAGQHQVRGSPPDDLGSLANGLRTSRAGGHHRIIVRLALEALAQMVGRHIAQQGHCGEGVHPSQAFVLVGLPGIEPFVEPANPSSHDNSRAFGIRHLLAQSGIGHGLCSGCQRKLRDARHAPRLLEINIVGGVESLDLPGDPDRQVAGIEVRDLCDP